jgi:glycopeptide antibiotics resistance protein
VIATILCLGVSLIIEVGQLLVFSDRVPSFTDLALNTLGGMFGAWLGENYLSRHYHRIRGK